MEKVPNLITPEIILKLRQSSTVTCDEALLPRLSTLGGNVTTSKSTEVQVTTKVNYELEKITARIQTNLTRIIEDVLSESAPSSERGDIFRCDPLKMLCLFNLEKDPCERINLAKVFPDVLNILEYRLKELKKTAMKPSNLEGDPFSNPAYYNSTWTSWGDVSRDNNSKPPSLSRIIVELILKVDAKDLHVLLFDNIMFRIIASPLLLAVDQISHLFVALFRSLLSLLIIVALIVMSLFILTGIKRLSILNDTNRFKANSTQLGIKKPVCKMR